MSEHLPKPADDELPPPYTLAQFLRSLLLPLAASVLLTGGVMILVPAGVFGMDKIDLFLAITAMLLLCSNWSLPLSLGFPCYKCFRGWAHSDGLFHPKVSFDFDADPNAYRKYRYRRVTTLCCGRCDHVWTYSEKQGWKEHDIADDVVT